MTEFDSPETLVAARARALTRAARSRLDGSGALDRPTALGSGVGSDDVGLPSLVAALMVEATTDGQATGASSTAVRTGVAVEALDRQWQMLALALDAAEGDDDAPDSLTSLMLWSDWLHARAHQLLLETSGADERVVSAVRTMRREVSSRNGRRERVECEWWPVVAVPSGVVDDETVSVVARSGGCSCALAARIGGLVGGAESGALERSVAYGRTLDGLMAGYGQPTGGRSGGAVDLDDRTGPDAGLRSGDWDDASGVLDGFEPPVSDRASEAVRSSPLRWLLLTVDLWPGGATE
jgi:hypothetical protein